MTPSTHQGEGDPNEIAAEHLESSAENQSEQSGVRTFQHGRFEIRREIGEGAAGTVKKAFDTVLERNCAIKWLHRTNRGEKQILRFQREARASSRLKHPGIVEIFDFGIADDGAPYLVMEYVDGVSLLTFMEDKGPLPIPQAIRIAELIAVAMAHAHSNNVIHRDLKPSNIILTGLTGGIESMSAKVVDFGMAAIEDDSLGKTMTPTQGLTGSPFYMSPEQARRVGVDGRADIYSLGCILFEMLVGKKPYCGDTTLTTIEMHITTPIPLAHEVAPESNIPESISRLTEKMMAKSKDERVLTMTEVVGLLEACATPGTAAEILEIADDKSNKSPKKRQLKKAILLALFAACALVFSVAPHAVQELKTPMFSLPAQKPVVENNESESDFKNLSRLVGVTVEQEKSISSKMIHLNGESVTDSTLRGVLMSGVDPPRQIYISRASITADALKIIAKCPSVEVLHLDYCSNIPDSAMVGLLPLKKLYILSLRGSNISDKALEFVAKIQSLDRVTVSDNPKVTISGVLKLATLPNLFCLGLGNTAIKGSDYAQLDQFKQLVVLNLDHSKVSDEDLESIGKLPFLQCISLTDADLSESGILALSNIPSLHSLRLADCKGPSIKTMFILKNKLKQHCLIEEKRPYQDERLHKR